MNTQGALHFQLPGNELDASKMPGHWLLARLGKRVLRPGGLEMTRAMLRNIGIRNEDDVVELAPGLGSTARSILSANPRSYTGIERDPQATAWSKRQIPQARNVSVLTGTADNTGLPSESASVVIGEAMLTMNTSEHKRRIVEEAHRLLRPGGRYGIHELCVFPDTIPAARHERVAHELSSAIHVGARPLRPKEWAALLESAGFRLIVVSTAPMNLLRPGRMVQDEGLLGALNVARNLLSDPAARKRVLEMRAAFERNHENLKAIQLVAVKE